MPLLTRLRAACAAALVTSFFPGIWVAAPAGASSCTPAFVEQVMPAPADHRAARAFGLDRIADNDIWAVGMNQLESDPFVTQPLAEHWDGTAWRITPVPAGGPDLFWAVDGVRPNDVWAVGSTIDSPAVVEHWNGSAWRAVAAPTGRDLFDVAAVASNDAWAVGDTVQETAEMLHWDGTAWHSVALPVQGGFLGGVTAISPTDVWAVGQDFATSDPLTLHWDGTAWTDVPTPAIRGGSLYHVSGTAADDVWAVGYRNTSSGEQKTLIEHWNGTTWSVVPSPNRGRADTHADELHGVSAISRNSAWAVGFVFSRSGTGMLLEHWDGTAWTLRRPPANLVPGTNRSLYAVSAAPGQNVLAVGATDDPATGPSAEAPMSVRHC